MDDHLAAALTAGRIAARGEAEAARLAAGVPRADRPHRWTAPATRLAAWAERLRAGRTLGVCCPA